MNIYEIIKSMKTECGAKTRSGGRCKNAPIGQTGRCRMHGGKSLGGIASPRYKHGRYSRYVLGRLAGRTWDEEVLQGLAVEQLAEQPIDLSEIGKQPIDLSWIDPSWVDEVVQGLNVD